MIHIPDAPHIRRAGWEPEAVIKCELCDTKMGAQSIHLWCEDNQRLCAACRSELPTSGVEEIEKADGQQEHSA